MKIDLVGPARRGLATGLNEAAGYLAVATTALVTGYLAASYGFRPAPFYLGLAYVNSFPYTCFAENVGLVRLTRVISRYVVAATGVIMVLIGLVPKAGAVVAGIPHPVLGGAALAMFATVAVVGVQTLSR
ncbi:MAG TPA: solute carrier family 23 protein, partial [Kribbella sp.]